MATIAEFLTNEHRCCDERFAATEEAAQTGDFAHCRAIFRQFQAMMEHHFHKEEAMLFPAFEQASGNAMGPTRVMRLEHQQMRATLAEMDSVLANGDLEDFLGRAETLLILMQQHSIKEEQILYPMCDRFLGDAVGAVIQAMRDLPAG